jgi:nitrogen regulatory protein PII
MAIDATNVPKILVIILHASDTPRLESFLHEKNAWHFVLISARGTVTSELIDVLGLSGTEKDFYLCVAPKSSVAALMTAVTERFELKKPGHGIAFVLPVCAMSAILATAVTAEMDESASEFLGATDGMTSVAADGALGRATDGAASSMAGKAAGALGRAAGRAAGKAASALSRAAGETAHRLASEGSKTMADENVERFELILSIINQGFSDELMDAAREAGARGGTVFHARGTARPEEEKFYGISLQHEKEIVVIVARKEQRRAIMDAVQKVCGKDTEANGVFLALPVEQSVGVS